MSKKIMTHSIASDKQAEDFAIKTGLRDEMLEGAFTHRFQHPEHKLCVFQKLSNPKRGSVALLCYFDGFSDKNENGWWAVKFDNVKTKKQHSTASKLIEKLIKQYAEHQGMHGLGLK
jgi:hypothetical protein